MSSVKFYIIFNILNILLIAFILFCMNGVFDLISDISPNANIMLLWGLALYITYVTLKLRLPKLIVKIGKKYTKTTINQFVEYLQNNPQNKKKILTIAFCYDIPFLIDSIHVYIDYFFIWTVIFTLFLYILFYVGGIYLFYLMLYKEIKMYKI